MTHITKMNHTISPSSLGLVTLILMGEKSRWPHHDKVLTPTTLIIITESPLILFKYCSVRIDYRVSDRAYTNHSGLLLGIIKCNICHNSKLSHSNLRDYAGIQLVIYRPPPYLLVRICPPQRC